MEIIREVERKGSDGRGYALVLRGGHLIQVIHHENRAIPNSLEDCVSCEVTHTDSSNQETIVREKCHASDGI